MSRYRSLFSSLLLVVSINASAENFTWSGPNVGGGYGSAGAVCKAIVGHLISSTFGTEYRLGSPFYRESSIYVVKNAGKPADQWVSNAGNLICNIERKDSSIGWQYGGSGTGLAAYLSGDTCGGDTTFGGDGMVGCTPNVDPDPNTNKGSPSCELKAGNPMNIATGNKFQAETDWQSVKNPLLKLERYYNSMDGQWRFNLSSSSIVISEGQPRCAVDPLMLGEPGCEVQIEYRAALHDGNGKATHFRSPPSDTLAETVGQWSNDFGNTSSLSKGSNYTNQHVTLNDVFLLKTGSLLEVFELESPSDGTLSYRLRYMIDQNGNAVIIGYLENTISFADPSGATITLSLDASNKVQSANLPNGASISYAYDTQQQLEIVTFPGAFSKQYLYENADKTLLTGIVDEKQVRFATWVYDVNGKAVASTHPNGVDNVTMVHNVDGSTSVTNPLGKETTYHFQTLPNGKKVPSMVEGHATPNCIASNKSYDYNYNGFIVSKTDWQGNVTTYDYNNRGLETTRTEAFGTALARTITTEWHPSLPLPVRITEPDRITEFTYDEKGLVINKIIRAI